MAEIVWWEIETLSPERFQRLHSALWGRSFEPAFSGTELGPRPPDHQVDR
jgi:hypothetical protein